MLIDCSNNGFMVRIFIFFVSNRVIWKHSLEILSCFVFRNSTHYTHDDKYTNRREKDETPEKENREKKKRRNKSNTIACYY